MILVTRFLITSGLFEAGVIPKNNPVVNCIDAYSSDKGGVVL